MTTPGPANDGHGLWRPRDWAESLCMPLADGTWLVQTPISAGAKPHLYLLRDAKMKGRFMFWAIGVIRLRIVGRAAISGCLLTLASMGLLTRVPGIGWWPLLPFLPMCLAGLVFVFWYQPFFERLEVHALKPPEGWRRPDMAVRTGAEGEALYLSNGARAERLIWLAVCGVAAAAMVLTTAEYLNICRGIGILDPLVMGREARERRWREMQ